MIQGCVDDYKGYLYVQILYYLKMLMEWKTVQHYRKINNPDSGKCKLVEERHFKMNDVFRKSNSVS